MRLTKRFWVSLLGCFLYPALAAQTPKFIYDSAPFPSAHASTLVELDHGDYMAAWFGGTAEGKPDVSIWAARLSSAGWSKPMELAREPGVPCWNPVLFNSHDGRLWLYYKFGPSPMSWSGARLHSDDEGRTWSPAEHLPAGELGPIRAKPLVLPGGLIVSGSSVESYSTWAVWIDRSTDNGRTWITSGPVTLAELKSAISPAGTEPPAKPIGIIQPVILWFGGRHLRMYARSSNQIGKICVADSFNMGKTWTDARRLDIPNPNAGIDLVRLHDGRIVLIYNDTTTGRTPLNLAISRDGTHFHNFATLENEAGEFSYPALIEGRDAALHMTYTWNRRKIRYVTIPLSAVPQ